jgi:hypothetical protein
VVEMASVAEGKVEEENVDPWQEMAKINNFN